MSAQAALWRDRVFARIWISFSCSEFGSSIVVTLIPLIAAAFLGATPLQMGILATANTVPYLVAAPIVGVIADRLSRRTILISADIGRALILIAGAVAAWSGHLSFEVLYAVAFAVGVGNVWYDVGHGSYLPFIVDRDRLIGANSYLSGSQSAAHTVGPSLAGALLQAAGTAFGIVSGAVLYVLSAMLLHSANPGRPAVADTERRSVWAEMRRGLSFIWRHPLLRPLTMRHATWHLVVGGIYSQIVLYLVTGLHFSAAEVGAMLTIIGLGTLTAALSGSRISHALGVGPAIMASNVAAAGFSLLIAVPSGTGVAAIAMIGAAMFVYGFCTMTYQINNASLRQTVTPDSLLGRMTAVTRMTTLGANAVGAVAAGLIAQYVSVGFAIAAFSILAVGASLWGLIATPLRSIRSLKQAESYS
jgi:MFS family permease